MFIKHISISDKNKDKRYSYYPLCESYRMGDALLATGPFYKVSKMLYRDNKEIDKFLSERTGKLFDVDEKIVLIVANLRTSCCKLG